MILTMYRVVCFNTQPPEGGWAKAGNKHVLIIVSTHSRLKAAGHDHRAPVIPAPFQHTAA